MALCMNDEILLLQLKRGNQLAFTSIYNKYAREAYVLAFKYLGSKELAEDAVQNLFLKIWNMTMQNPQSMSCWKQSHLK